MQTKKKEPKHTKWRRRRRQRVLAVLVVYGQINATIYSALDFIVPSTSPHSMWLQHFWTSYWLLASPSLFIQWFLSRQLFRIVFFSRLRFWFVLPSHLNSPIHSRRHATVGPNIFINKYWYYEYRNFLQNWNIVINRQNNGILAH